MRVSVEVSGDSAVERRLLGMGRRGEHTAGIFMGVLGDLEEAERAFFGAHGTGLWPAMDPSTKKRWGEHELLDLSGTLMRSLTDRHAPYGIREARDGEARFGTSDPVAHLQAEGRGAPKRAVLAPLARSRTGLAEKLRRHIMEGT
jgi:hypothetical protein